MPLRKWPEEKGQATEALALTDSSRQPAIAVRHSALIGRVSFRLICIKTTVHVLFCKKASTLQNIQDA